MFENLNYRYKLHKEWDNATDKVVHRFDTVGIGTTVATVIPLTDEGNMDYVSYKAWLDAGNTPEAAD